jgi:hypothetical protein
LYVPPSSNEWLSPFFCDSKIRIVCHAEANLCGAVFYMTKCKIKIAYKKIGDNILTILSPVRAGFKVLI